MTYYGALKNAEKNLENAGVPDSANDARLMLQAASGRSSASLLADRDCEMTGQESLKFESMVSRRLKREPLQHILGIWEFMGYDFYCSPDCLIPRQDTELLVLTAFEAVKNISGKRTDTHDESAFSGDRINVLDLCTGSGCVIISLKKLCGDTIGAAGADISLPALETARKNALLNKVSVDFFQSDMFEKVGDNSFDIITANPPYVETGVIAGLQPEITEYEPWIALDGGEDGLKHYRTIINGAGKHLKTGGSIIMEIGDDQGEAVSSMLTGAGYDSVVIRKDLSGADRVAEAVWNGARCREQSARHGG